MTAALVVIDMQVSLIEDETPNTDEIMSAVFRKGGDCPLLVEDLKAVFESHKGEERAIVLLNMLHRQQRPGAIAHHYS